MRLTDAYITKGHPLKAMNIEKQTVLGKVPEVTLIFWVIKILATTLGETGGDTVILWELAYLPSFS
jgi:uncharacterized membrane-anchored protein